MHGDMVLHSSIFSHIFSSVCSEAPPPSFFFSQSVYMLIRQFVHKYVDIISICEYIVYNCLPSHGAPEVKGEAELNEIQRMHALFLSSQVVGPTHSMLKPPQHNVRLLK